MAIYRRFVFGVVMLLSAVLLVMFGQGCATAPVEEKLTVKTITIAKSPQSDLEVKFQEVLDYCAPRLNQYETKALSQASKAYWLNVSGLLAGSVFAPFILAFGATGATWMAVTAGLSGYAGTVPFMSEALRASGLSGAGVAQMRNEIVARIREKAAIAIDGALRYNERRAAIMAIAAECSIYPIVVPSVYEFK